MYEVKVRQKLKTLLNDQSNPFYIPYSLIKDIINLT